MTWQGRRSRRTLAALLAIFVLMGTELMALPARAAPTLGAPGGQVFAWGRNGDGQIGDDTTTDRHDPVQVLDPSGETSLGGVIAVAGGYFHTLAVLSDGTVVAWGSNDSGQLGQGTTGGPDRTRPVSVPGLSNITAVSANGFQSMALESDGDVWQWGIIPGFSSNAPVKVTLPVAATQVAAGVNHSLALGSNGKVYAWGQNCYGQLGDGGTTGPIPSCEGARIVTTPVVVKRLVSGDPVELTGVSAVSAGQFHSTALVSGEVWSWGLNDQGQVGNGGTSDAVGTAVRGLADPIDSVPLTGVVEIDAGSNHTLARLSDGTVQFTGGSGGGSGNAFDPVPGSLTDVAQVTGGEFASFFLFGDGTVRAWGNNSFGQLGDGTTTNRPTPVTITSLVNPLAVEAGHLTNYAIASTGAIANVILTVNQGSSNTGITEAPLEDVPAAHIPQQFGQTPTAPIGRIPIGRIPIGRIPIGRIPIGRIDTGDLPIGRIPIGRIPIGRIGTYALGRATLAEFPIYRAGGWPAILAQTATLAASTPQGTTFAQLWADPNVQGGLVPELNPASPDALRLDEFNLALSPLASVSLLSLLLGDLTWNDINYRARPRGRASFCEEWTDVGRNCAGTPGTGDLILEADLSGFPFDRSTLALHTVGDIDPARLNQALFPSLTLFDVQIRGSALADIRLGDIPSATRGDVMECSATGVDCSDGSTQKLGNEPAYSAIKRSAMFAHLGTALNPIAFGDLALAFVPRSALPWEDIPLSDVPFEKYTQDDNEPAHLVGYTIAFDLSCDDVAGLRADVTLPPGFRYRPGSSDLSDGDSLEDFQDPSQDGQVLSWKPKPSETLCTAVVGETRHMEILFQVMPGFDVGTFGATGSVRTSTLSPVPADNTEAAVEVVDFEPFEGPSLEAFTDTLIVGQITGTADVDDYDFTAIPGQTVSVSLSHVSRDLDLVMYAPVGAQTQQLLRSTPAQEIPFGKAPLADPGDAIGGVLPPEVVQDIHVDPDRPVAGISSFRGTDGEFVQTTAVEGTSGPEYRIQVTGYNGAYGPEPYVLLIRQSDPVTLPPCQARSFPDAGTPAAGPLPAVSSVDNTLFIVDKERLEMAFGSGGGPGVIDADDVIADVETLAGSGATTGVHGKVVYVDGDLDVQTAFTDLDLDPCSPQANDDVVRAINDVIDGMRALNDFSGVRSIVIVGDDDIIPHARLLDATSDGNERGFAGDMFFQAGLPDLRSNQFTGAFGNGYFLSDAPYGAFVPLSLAGQVAYVPQVAVGRLPGDAATIHAAFQTFEASAGVADPNSTTGDPATAFVTHYDFFTDGGELTVANLTKPGRLDPADVTELGGSWTRDQFRSAFTQQADPADIVAPNAHYDQSRLLPGEGDATGDPSTVYTTADLRTDAPNLSLRIVFGIGCHTALGLPDRLAGATPTAGDAARVDDWAQAYADQGAAVLVGNLGYGFGDTATVGFSEQVMANFADELFTNPTVGAGLLRAQQDYFTQMASFTPYDLKALQQVVTWGFPMYRMPGAPSASAQAAAVASVADTTSQDPISSLESTTILVSPNFTKVTLSDGTAFYEADDGAQTTHGYPIVPKFVEDIPAGPSNMVAHGAAPIDLRTVGALIDEPIRNAFANATLDSSEREPAPASEVVYPTTLQNIGTFIGADGSITQQLVVTPGQFRSDADLTNDPGIGTIRRFRGTWLVTYSGEMGDFVGPQISLVEALEVGANTAFAVDATDGAGVSRVFVQALLADGTYSRVELGSPGGDGNGRWTGGMTGTPLEVFVFAFDGNANSSSATQKGPGYIPTETPPPPPGVTVTVNGDPPRDGWYTGDDVLPLDVAVTPADNQLRVDGGPAQTGSAEVSGEGVHRVDVFTPEGAPSGSVLVAIDTMPPDVLFVTPPAGSPYGVNEDVTEDYECIDVGSGVASCTDLNPGTKLDTARPGPHTFTVTAEDIAGHDATTETETYVVSDYDFQGLFAPIDNPPAVNSSRAGQVIPVRWRISDSNGAGVDDPGSFVAVTTTSSGACNGLLDSIEETAGSSGLIYLGDGRWQFNWKTPSSFAGHCRILQLRLFDGTPNGKVYATAKFVFR